jgi:hypothetical protein
MSPPTSNDPVWIGVLDRVYVAALWLYPSAHRHRWGAEMRLAFRDRCREAAAAGRGPFNVVFAELLPDLVSSATHERVVALFIHRHEGGPMQKLISTLLVLVGASLFAVSAIGLWHGYFARTGMLDSLGIMQIALGVAGVVFTGMGLREPKRQVTTQMQD